MRTPEQILTKAIKSKEVGTYNLRVHTLVTGREALKAIAEAQKEAWNEAIEQAAKEAKTKLEWQNVCSESYYENVIDKNSILKLKK